jgi:hypothetical protein
MTVPFSFSPFYLLSFSLSFFYSFALSREKGGMGAVAVH